MDAGLHYFSFTHPEWEHRLAERLTATARAADSGGFELLTVMDHYFQMEVAGGPAEPMLEGYTTLGYLAGVTERINLGLLVTGVTYRHPGLLAKIIATLDVLSGGRAWLGIGAAWYEREHAGLGVPFPSTSERFERLEETLQIIRQMWSPQTNGAFAGAHYELAETINVPATVQARIPVLVGGGGERKTLRLVAEYADACHLFLREGAETVAHKLGVLRDHCDRVGRDYDSIRKTVGGTGVPDPLEDVDAYLRLMESYAALGVTLVTVSPYGDDPVAWTEGFAARVLPRLREIGPA